MVDTNYPAQAFQVRCYFSLTLKGPPVSQSKQLSQHPYLFARTVACPWKSLRKHSSPGREPSGSYSSPPVPSPQIPYRPTSPNPQCLLLGGAKASLNTTGTLAAWPKILSAACSQMAGWKYWLTSPGCPPPCQPKLCTASRVEVLVCMPSMANDLPDNLKKFF